MAKDWSTIENPVVDFNETSRTIKVPLIYYTGKVPEIVNAYQSGIIGTMMAGQLLADEIKGLKVDLLAIRDAALKKNAAETSNLIMSKEK